MKKKLLRFPDDFVVCVICCVWLVMLCPFLVPFLVMYCIYHYTKKQVDLRTPPKWEMVELNKEGRYEKTKKG